MFKPTYGIPANFLAELYVSTLMYFANYSYRRLDRLVQNFALCITGMHFANANFALILPVECHHLVLSPQSQEGGFESAPEPYPRCWE